MATPPFKYQPMFEHGEDKTEYYLLTKDYVSVSEFEGNAPFAQRTGGKDSERSRSK